jgi:hypothetical protein
MNTCNPRYSRGSRFNTSPGKKLVGPNVNKPLDVVVHLCNLGFLGGRD